MTLCSKCKKRVAVVFMTRFENGETINEGLCIRCARDLGIGPVNDMLKKLGIDDDQLDRMSDDMEQMIAEMGENAVFGPDADPDALPDEADAEEDDGDEDAEESFEPKAPTIDFQKLMNSAAQGNVPAQDPAQGSTRQQKKEEKQRKKKRKFLDSFCVNLTARAADGALDPVIGRTTELDRVEQILCRRKKNNPCLIGEPGVGKTAVAEALAQHVVSGNVPARLLHTEIQLLDMTAMVAGTQFRGQFEARMKGLIEEVKALGNVILVIDEVHTIAGAGDAEGSMNAANILKPALSRGDIQVIGATTLAEYRKYIEKDAALERRFQPVMINEPSIPDTVEILKGIRSQYESFHGIKIPEALLEKAVVMSERYITDRFLPDKAIDLLDEASAYIALHTPVVDEMNRLDARLADLRSEREALEGETSEEGSESRYERIAELRSEEMQSMARFEELTPARDAVALTEDALAAVIELWTGIPASSITEHEFRRLDQLGDRLRGRIVGQDEAVDAVVRAVRRSRTGVAYKKKPVSFIFAGPTGVGKTELVKTLAKELFQTPDALIRLDMSEYMEKYAVSRMIGSPPGYVGYDDAGQLTEKIRRKPYSVVLFDEIEKAHPDVLNILLQILDDGRLTDAQGREINFQNAVIVMTTNAGSQTNDNTAGFRANEKQIAENRTEKALLSFLRPEFINRVDEIITFRGLEEEDFVSIAKIMMEELVGSLSEKDIMLAYTADALRLIAKESFSRKYGARNMRRYIQTHVEDAIANQIIAGYQKHITCVTVSTEKDETGKETLTVGV